MENEMKKATVGGWNWKRIGVLIGGVLVALFFILGAYTDNIIAWSAERRAKNYDAMLADSTKKYNAALAADTYGGATPEETLDLLILALEKNDIALVVKYYPVNIQEEVGEKYAQRTKEDLKFAANSLKELRIGGTKVCMDSGCAIRHLKVGDELPLVVNFSTNNITKVWKIENPY